MLTLALDSAADGISVAVLNGKDVLAQDAAQMARGQGEALIPMIQAVVQKTGLQMNNLDQIAVSVGPGSFTGVRIGLATARAIAMALDKPVWGVSTLAAAACGVAGKVLAVSDTKRDDFYTQLFQDGQEVEPPCIRTLEEIAKLMPIAVTGSGAMVLTAHLPCTVIDTGLTPAVAVGLCALTRHLAPEPLYLRDADVHC